MNPEQQKNLGGSSPELSKANMSALIAQVIQKENCYRDAIAETCYQLKKEREESQDLLLKIQRIKELMTKTEESQEEVLRGMGDAVHM